MRMGYVCCLVMSRRIFFPVRMMRDSQHRDLLNIMQFIFGSVYVVLKI